MTLGRLVFVEEPGSAVVILTIMGPDEDLALEEYAENYRASLGGEVPFSMLKQSTTVKNTAGVDCRFVLQIFGIKVPHTTNITKHVFGETKVICVTQVSDEDRHLVDAGFLLVKRTMKSDSPTAPENFDPKNGVHQKQP